MMSACNPDKESESKAIGGSTKILSQYRDVITDCIKYSETKS
jgi:hypothetical protein